MTLYGSNDSTSSAWTNLITCIKLVVVSITFIVICVTTEEENENDSLRQYKIVISDNYFDALTWLDFVVPLKSSVFN